ncbi:dienelactone hydrolase family protein [Streptomyces subrutilus]|uniref:dienelactone hydrolase family protein n=1 Tax=Streptomyces subrutilus TaxID=36818 RepID=UPI003421AD84
MYDALLAETVTFTGHGGDRVEAYAARPLAPGPFGGVVVIHHMPGYDRATKEIVRRFAVEGYAALCPNLYSREAPGASPEEASAIARSRGGVPDERLVGDVSGAVRELRGLASSNQRVAVVGYCSGGRQALLAACELDLDAAVDCYGAFATRLPPEDFPLAVTPVTPLLPGLSCPLLGLFGAEDTTPSPEETAELEAALKARGKEYEFHTLAGAGHAFFAVDRERYRPEPALEGWRLLLDFLARHLATDSGARATR